MPDLGYLLHASADAEEDAAESLDDTAAAPSRTSREANDTLASEVLRDYQEWKQFRTPHEGDWFVNAAMLRGQQHVLYDQTNAQLVTPEAPTYAVRIDLNKILPKHRARMARFFKNRPKPLVVPASTEYKDLMHARSSERALNYQWARLRLESLYRDARQWASVASKAYLFLGYDPMVTGRVKMTDPLTGRHYTETAVLGDVFVEVANAWEVLVPDPSRARLSQQEKMLRVRSLPRGEAERRFPQVAQQRKQGTGSAASASTLKATEDKIANLTAGDQDGAPAPKRSTNVLLLEHYTAPCGQYPHGRRLVVCDGVLVDHADELPFQFWNSPSNPYPCVEFSDSGNVGQFWHTTWVAQLVPLQRMLNRMLELIVENAEAVGRPKLLVYKQHQLPDGAYTSAAGEIIEVNYVPGVPDPRPLPVPSVSGDIWNMVNLILRQFDDVSQIQTAAEGGSGGAESGYQTNLLQEASDAVHAPDIRGDELAIEDLAWKIRRIMKRTWDTPRLLAVGGESATTEMLEFSNEQIDDAAEVRIQIGSMLPDLKAAKAQTALNYYKEGLLGDPADPLVRRKALAMIDLVGYDVVSEEDRLDEDEAQRENQMILDGGAVKPAEFYQQHLVHIQKHEARMKTPEWALLADDRKLIGYAHLITHYDFVNLPLAMGLRQQYGLQGLPVAAPPPPPAPAAPGPSGPPPSGEAPPMPSPPSLGGPAPMPPPSGVA